MSKKLLEQLYRQIKRVMAKPLALTNELGLPFEGFNDFAKTKSFAVKPPSPERRISSVDEQGELKSIPIYFENKFVVYIILEISETDLQTLDVITSLAELISQQFILEHRPRPDAVDLLLTRLAYRSSSIDPEELEQQLAALGYSLDLPRAAVVIELKGFWDNYLQQIGSPLGDKENLIAAKKRDIDQSFASFFTKNMDNLVGFIGNDTFLILKDLRDTDYDKFCTLLTKHFSQITDVLKNIHIKEITIGIGEVSSSPDGLIRSVQEALQVLNIGKRIIGTNRALRFSGLGSSPLIIPGSEDLKRDFSQKILRALDDPQLIETLRIFLHSNLNLTQASEALKIHRNTVIYRLDKITEKISLDPRHFPDAVELHLALLFAQFFG